MAQIKFGWNKIVEILSLFEDLVEDRFSEPRELEFVELKELQPYHWTNAYPAEELEHWQA